MKYYTTIEQSKKLVELGLNPDTADMKWFYWEGEIDIPKVPILGFDKAAIGYYKNTQAVYLPCWSFGALINVMPSMIYKSRETFTLRMYKDAIYHICYRSHYHLDEMWFSKENLLDAAFEMVCWLLENDYIKKGE